MIKTKVFTSHNEISLDNEDAEGNQILGLGKNTGTPVYRGISLAWYVPRHASPYRGILVFLFIVTKNLKFPKY